MSRFFSPDAELRQRLRANFRQTGPHSSQFHFFSVTDAIAHTLKPMQHPTIHLALMLLLAVPTLRSGDCGTAIEINSRTEYYLSASDILETSIPDIPGPLGDYLPNPLKIPTEVFKAATIADIIEKRCAAFELFSGGLKLTVGPGVNSDASGPSWMRWALSGSGFSDHFKSMAEDVVVNGEADKFKPDYNPCDERPMLTLAHLGGDLSGTVTDFGVGVYPRRITEGKLHLCRNFVVENASGTSVELPLSVSGNIYFEGGIAADDAVGRKNYAKAWLKITGSVGGESVSEKAELSASGFELAGSPEKAINSTRRITVGSGSQTNEVHIDLNCEGYLEVQAHGSALLGFIGDSVSGQVQFPNSIEVGWPTGPNGSSIPAGVRIYDAEDGSVYVDTTAGPVAVVPVSAQTHVWFFDRPFDIGLGGLLAGVHSSTAYGSTTVLSPPGTGAGLVRRADADSDALLSVTDHNAFRLSYTVAQTNTTPTLTLFIYDQLGGTPHALAYDLDLTPGYHEATLLYSQGDTAGRGMFIAGEPDLTRLHSIAIANTLLTDWPAQSSLITTDMLAVTFHHLAAITASTSGYDGLAFTNLFVDPTATLHLQYLASTNDYYMLYSGPVVTNVTTPIAMALGVDGPAEFLLTNIVDTAFFRLREVPLAQPLDLDRDGFDDVRELRNPDAFNPFVPATPIVTNQTPVNPGTNTPSNSGQIYLWTVNNHRYMPVAVTNGVTWDQANAAATSAGGHLATITSAAENDFIFALIDRAEYWTIWPTNPPAASGPWLAGWQPAGSSEPAGSWGWLTQEVFDFTAWSPGSPDNASSPFGADENHVSFASASANSRSSLWNDLPSALPLPGYVIEFDPPNTSADCVPRDGLVAWWKADGNALDSAGTNNGVMVDTVAFADGISGQAFSFDGVTSFIEVPDSVKLDLTGPLTLECWLRLNKLDEIWYKVVVWKGPHGESRLNPYALEFSTNNTLYFGIGDGTLYNGIEGSTKLTSNVWYHVAGVADGTNLQLYLDGRLEAVTSQTISPYNNSYPLHIGNSGHDTPGMNQFNGRVDDFRIYNRALAAAEIAGIYSGGITGHCTPECVEPTSGLVAWLPGDGNANDLIGGKNGTLMGGATASAAGVVGQAFSFSGGMSYVSNRFQSLVQVTNSFTMEFWAWPTAPRDLTPEATQDMPGISGQRYAIYPEFGSGPIYFPDLAGAGVSVGSNGVSVFEHGVNYLPSLLVYNAPISGWTHIAVVYANKRPSLYVNGTLVRVGLQSERPTVFASLILGDNLGLYGPYEGLLDEVSIYNRALSRSEIAAICSAGSAGKCKKLDCPQAPTGVVAWWPADGNANDVVGNNTGTLVGDATFTGGIVGQAFNLPGSSVHESHVEVPDAPELRITGPLTLDAWVSFRGVDPQKLPDSMAPILAKWGDTLAGTAGYGLFVRTNGIPVFGVSPDGVQVAAVVSPEPLPTNIFVHLAGVYTGSRLELYANGTLIGTSPFAGPIHETSVPLVIGGYRTPFTHENDSFVGMIDEPRIFNRALSASEIQSLYQSVTPAPLGPVVDHGGTNWTITAGVVLGGAHVNIGEFVVPTGISAAVAPFDGTNGGWLEIRARSIRVDGTLDATGAGYPGGGGGGGGGGADQLEADGGRPGKGAAGGDEFLGGHRGERGDDGVATTGGYGGRGGMSLLSELSQFPGTGGPRGRGAIDATTDNTGPAGVDGGYFAPLTNGDTTAGDEVAPGCGGGGGSGGGGGYSLDCNSGGGGGGGGGSGGFGGGAIVLRAEQTLQINGALLAQGTRGAAGTNGLPGNPFDDLTYPSAGWTSPGGDGGQGGPAGAINTGLGGGGGARARDTVGAQSGNYSGAGGRGGDGGAGAGGGILLRAPLVTVTGTINNSGGSSTNNGGTVKIYSTCGGQAANGPIVTSRLVQKSILMRPATGR